MELARTRHHLQPAALHWQDSAGIERQRTIKVHGDPDELRTAVSNILDNAIKYSGSEVDVSVGIDTPDEKLVALRVRDRGVGIPAGELKRIFKRFYRVPRSVRVARRRAPAWVCSSFGRSRARTAARCSRKAPARRRGTTVTLELPRSRGVSRVLVVEDEAHLAGGPALQSGSGRPYRRSRGRRRARHRAGFWGPAINSMRSFST